MHTIRLRQALVTLTAAALLASLTMATAAAPTSAAKPKCAGKTATIVGTEKADLIVGTRKRDVIVAKGGADRIFGRGGNDLICAGAGNDRVVGNAGIDKLIAGTGADKLFGGPGPDRLFGGPGPDLAAGQLGNDVIDGGFGVDTCYQNTGNGPMVRCELPLPPDIDGDGLRNEVDACPSQGDLGFGLDGSGCPKAPANGFQAQCVADGGGYSEGTGGADYHCQWQGASPYASIDAMATVYYVPICINELGVSEVLVTISAPASISCSVH